MAKQNIFISSVQSEFAKERQAPTKYHKSKAKVQYEFRSTPIEVRNLLKVIDGEMSRQEIQDKLSLKDRVYKLKKTLIP